MGVIQSGVEVIITQSHTGTGVPDAEMTSFMFYVYTRWKLINDLQHHSD